MIRQTISEAEYRDGYSFSFNGLEFEANVIGDFTKIKRVMQNLIKNGIDAMSDGGNMSVRLSALEVPRDGALSAYPHLVNMKKGDYFLISVNDQGKGISPEDITRVFDPYFSTKKGSIGLGLYMSKMIVEQHLNGQITVEHLNRGCRFSVILPAPQKTDLEL